MADNIKLVTKEYVDTGLTSKVDKEDGKGLSTNDFTNEDKEKLYSALQKENIDQTYNSTSENAQSGIAVAEALSIEQKHVDNTFANALKGSKSGSAILIDDVSPVEHTMGVKVKGKNLLPPADSGIYYNGSIYGGNPFIASLSYGISDFNDIDISKNRGVYAVIKLTEGESICGN